MALTRKYYLNVVFGQIIHIVHSQENVKVSLEFAAFSTYSHLQEHLFTLVTSIAITHLATTILMQCYRFINSGLRLNHGFDIKLLVVGCLCLN